MKRRAALSRLLTVRTSWAAMSWLTKLAHVKAAVVVAVTAVEGADVRAEGEAVNGVEVVAEDATKRPCPSPFCVPSPAATAGQFLLYGSLSSRSAII